MRLLKTSPVGGEVAPLERIMVPESMDGSRGANRATGTCQIAAADDLAAIHAWLSRFEGRSHTFRDHRKEAERMLLWAVMIARKPLSSLTVEDCLAFRAFLADPRPVDQWVGPRAKRFSPEWRPFTGPLSPSSRRHAEAVLGSLFSWLKDVGYLAGNPWKAMGAIRVAASGTVRIERIIDVRTWADLSEFVLSLPNDAKSVRRRFLVMTLYLTRMRIAELASARMSDVIEIHRGNRVQWWLKVNGKGGKEREVPVPVLMRFLREYRASIGLPEWPAGEDMPLLGRAYAAARPVSPNGIHRELKRLLGTAADHLDRPDLRRVSAHWLRHSGASHGLDEGEPLQSVQGSLGHASLQTTSIYIHADRDRQYEVFEGRAVK